MTFPDFPVVDSHLHLWDVSRLDYPWLIDSPIGHTSLMADFDRARGRVEVDKVVFMQAECVHSQYMEEVAFVTEQAQKDARIKAIIAWAPLETVIMNRHALSALAANPLVKGVRRLIQTEDSASFCAIPAFREGVRALAGFNMTFDLGIHQGQLRDAARLADACPDTRFVADHLGKPAIRENGFDVWKDELRELSRRENVMCKLSSLATEADHAKWTVDEVRPYAEWVVECFGIDRVMFGGDWPVSSEAADYETCVSTICEIFAGMSDADMRKLFRENAERFYGI